MYWRFFAGVLLLLAMATGCGAELVPHHQVTAELQAMKAAAERSELKGVKDDRKIIYTGQLNLAVKSLDDTEREIKRLLAAAEGQIAEFKEERTAGDQRAGHWKVRVPPGKFTEFVEQVAGLGVAERREMQAADVTEEFVDVEARLKNKRQLEARILKLLDDKTGEIKDVVAVENELARVREEIERIEGRLRMLSNQIDLSTITIFAYERREYIPPTAPTFRERVAFAFSTSLRNIREMGEMLVIAIVALAPWFVLFAILGGLTWMIVSRVIRILFRPVR